MQKKTLALLSGGISSEREVSLNSGEQVKNALDKDKYEVRHYDPKTDLAKLVTDAPQIDAALIILHGPFGEDGTVQGLLDLLDIPYQGAGVMGSAQAMNKLVSKTLYAEAGLTVPPYRVTTEGQAVDSKEVVAELGLPLVIKPAEAGSSVGMSIIHGAEDLNEALAKAYEFDSRAIIEAYIEGVEITGGILGNDELTALPLIEIIPGDDYTFFDYEAKYTAGATREICPARIDADLTARAQRVAQTAHQALSLQGYSRTDMIIKDDTIYILETNTIPGMTATSLYPQAAAKAGYSFTQVLDRLIELGIEAHAKRKR
jgi:D-alanine-D-alanine ligase